MKESDAKELERFLIEVANNGSYLPTEETYRAIHKVIPWPAVEILITDPSDPFSFLLTYRNDRDWKGWHIPGGFVRHTDTSLIEACRNIAKRELGDGFTIQDATLIMAHKWTNHPYGSPVSLVYVCAVDTKPSTNKTTQFFKEIPVDALPYHIKFLEQFMAWRNGETKKLTTQLIGD